MLHHGVTFSLESLLCLENREVKLGDKLPIHPWFSLIIMKEFTLRTWQKEYYQHHGNNDQCRS